MKKTGRISQKETTSTGGNQNCNQNHHQQQTPDQFFPTPSLAGSNQTFLSLRLPLSKQNRESDQEPIQDTLTNCCNHPHREQQQQPVELNCPSGETSPINNKSVCNGLTRRPSLPPKGIVRSRIKQFAKFNPQSIAIVKKNNKSQQVAQNFQASSTKKKKTPTTTTFCSPSNEILAVSKLETKCEQTPAHCHHRSIVADKMTIDVVEKVMAQNKSEIEQQQNCNGINKNRGSHLTSHHHLEKLNNGNSNEVVSNGMNIYYDRSSTTLHHQKSRESNLLNPASSVPSTNYNYKRPSSVSSSNHDSTLSSNGSLINSTDVSPGEEEEEDDHHVHQHQRSNNKFNGSRRGTAPLIRDNLSHDSLDELEYGPGIVAKLKSKFLKYSSITSGNNNNNNNSVVRRNKINGLKLKRSSSLENILNNDHHQDEEEDESHDFHGLVIIHQESDEDQDITSTMRVPRLGESRMKNQVRRASESVITSANGYHHHVHNPLAAQNRVPVIKSIGGSKDPSSSVRNNGSTTGLVQPVILNALEQQQHRVKKCEVTSSINSSPRKIVANNGSGIVKSNIHNNTSSMNNNCEKIQNGASTGGHIVESGVMKSGSSNENCDQTLIVNHNNSKTSAINGGGSKMEYEPGTIHNNNQNGCNGQTKNSGTSSSGGSIACRKGSVFLKQYLNTVQNTFSTPTSDSSSSANNCVINHPNLVNGSKSPSPTSSSSSPPAKSAPPFHSRTSPVRSLLNSNEQSPTSSSNSSPDNNNKFSNSNGNSNKLHQFTRRASHNPSSSSRGILLNKSAFNNKNSLVLKRAKSLETLLLDASPESVSRSCTGSCKEEENVDDPDEGNDEDSDGDVDGCEDDNLSNEEIVTTSNNVVTATPMAIVNPTVHDLQEKKGNAFNGHVLSEPGVCDSGRSPLIERVSNGGEVMISAVTPEEKTQLTVHNNYDRHDHHNSNDANVKVAAIDDHLSDAVEIKVNGDFESRRSNVEEMKNLSSPSANVTKEKISIPSNHQQNFNNVSTPQVMREETKLLSDQSAATNKITKPIPPARSGSGIQGTRGGGLNRRTSLPVLTSSVATESNGSSGSDKISAGSLRRGSTLPSVKPMIALKPKVPNKPLLPISPPSTMVAKSNDAVTNGGKKEEVIPVTRPPRTKKGSTSSSNRNNLTGDSTSSAILPNNKETVSNGLDENKKISSDVIKTKDTMGNECLRLIKTERVPSGSQDKKASNDSYLKVDSDENGEMDNKELKKNDLNTDSPSVTISKSSNGEDKIIPFSSSAQITSSASTKNDSECPSTQSTVEGNQINGGSSSIKTAVNACNGNATGFKEEVDSQSGRQISGSYSSNNKDNNISPLSLSATTLINETTPACNAIQDLVNIIPSSQVKPSSLSVTSGAATPSTATPDIQQKQQQQQPGIRSKPSTPDDGDALEHDPKQKRISSTSSSVSDEIIPLIPSPSKSPQQLQTGSISSITSTCSSSVTMTPLPTQTISSSTISQPVPAPRRTTTTSTATSTIPNQPSPPLPSSLPPPIKSSHVLPSANLSSCLPSSTSSLRGPPPSAPSNGSSSCMIFDFRGKDVKPSLAISSPFGRSAVISGNDDDESEDYRGSMVVPPPSGLVFIGENEVVGKGSLLKSRNKKVS